MIAQVLADHAADFVGMGDHSVQRAVLVQPFDGGLGAAFLDAGHAVHGVADQRQVVDDALRRHAELGHDAGLVEHFVAHGVDQRTCGLTSCVRSLSPVEISASMPLTAAAVRQGADHVVGFDAIDHQHRPAGGADGGVQRFDLPRPGPPASAAGAPCIRDTSRRGRSCPWRRRRRPCNLPCSRFPGGVACSGRHRSRRSARRPCCAGRAGRETRGRGRTSRPPTTREA